MQQAVYLHNNPLKAIKMKQLERILAEKLLKISAIKLQPEIPFVWASGWNSPIYTDNRKTLSYPEIRNFIKVELTRLIMENFSDAEVVAGVATGAIAQGALVADTMGVPYIYVRSSPKDHGLENLIEGNLKSGQKVVVIEDLISTGGSSLKAVEAIRQVLSSDNEGMKLKAATWLLERMDSIPIGECNPFKVLREKATYDEMMKWDTRAFHPLEYNESLEELGLKDTEQRVTKRRRF